MEDKVVTISRATGSLTFPANFMLVAAMLTGRGKELNGWLKRVRNWVELKEWWKVLQAYNPLP